MADLERGVETLARELKEEVLTPANGGYPNFMQSLFATDSQATRPCCIVQPASIPSVLRTMQIANEYGLPVTVRGGGLSTLCSKDGAVLIDLKTRMTGAKLRGDSVVVQGGGTMGQMLDALAPLHRVVPVGVSMLPGLGLATQGGVGHLTRTMGLTLDHLEEVEIVTAEGRLLQLSSKSTGDEADLWWAVRGCAPAFGVVVAATFRSQLAPDPLYVHRALFPVDVFPPYVEWANTLGNDLAASAVLSKSSAAGADPEKGVLYSYVVYAGNDERRWKSIVQSIADLARSIHAEPLWTADERSVYSKMPEFDPPAIRKNVGPGLTDSRVFCGDKSPFLKGMTATIASDIIRAFRGAPTELCRHDFQHIGGAMNDVTPTATAFHCRNIEWNTSLIGAFAGSEEQRKAGAQWVAAARKAMEPCLVGAYSVSIPSNSPDAPADVKLAFGPNLDKLRQLKRKWDPNNVFRMYYPLG